MPASSGPLTAPNRARCLPNILAMDTICPRPKPKFRRTSRRWIWVGWCWMIINRKNQKPKKNHQHNKVSRCLSPPFQGGDQGAVHSPTKKYPPHSEYFYYRSKTTLAKIKLF